MICLRENCKEEQGQKEPPGAETEAVLSPDPPLLRLSAIHFRSAVYKFIGKMSSQFCRLGEGRLSCGHFRKKAGAGVGDVHEELMEPALCLGTKHEVLTEQTQKWRKPASVVLSWGQAVSQGTHFVVIL